MKRFQLIGIICILLLGCGPSTKQVMNSWMGSHISEVIRSWGPPQQIVTDGAGGQIYIWSSQPTIPPVTQPTTTETRGEMRYNPLTRKYEWVETTKQKSPQTVPGVMVEVLSHSRRVRMFYARPNGIIYHWRSKG